MQNVFYIGDQIEFIRKNAKILSKSFPELVQHIDAIEEHYQVLVNLSPDCFKLGAGELQGFASTCYYVLDCIVCHMLSPGSPVGIMHVVDMLNILTYNLPHQHKNVLHDFYAFEQEADTYRRSDKLRYTLADVAVLVSRFQFVIKGVISHYKISCRWLSRSERRNERRYGCKYKSKMCVYHTPKNQCTHGDNCWFAHSESELRTYPNSISHSTQHRDL